MANGTSTQQIEGLPPGAIVRPMQTQQSIEGLPPGAIVRPIGQPQQQPQQPPPEGYFESLWRGIGGPTSLREAASSGIIPKGLVDAAYAAPEFAKRSGQIGVQA